MPVMIFTVVEDCSSPSKHSLIYQIPHIIFNIPHFRLIRLIGGVLLSMLYFGFDQT